MLSVPPVPGPPYGPPQGAGGSCTSELAACAAPETRMFWRAVIIAAVVFVPLVQGGPPLKVLPLHTTLKLRTSYQLMLLRSTSATFTALAIVPEQVMLPVALELHPAGSPPPAPFVVHPATEQLYCKPSTASVYGCP